MDANMQLTINSLEQLFPTRFFPDISLNFSKFWHFPDSCQIPLYFQVNQTSGQPDYNLDISSSSSSLKGKEKDVS